MSLVFLVTPPGLSFPREVVAIICHCGAWAGMLGLGIVWVAKRKVVLDGPRLGKCTIHTELFHKIKNFSLGPVFGAYQQ